MVIIPHIAVAYSGHCQQCLPFNFLAVPHASIASTGLDSPEAGGIADGPACGMPDGQDGRVADGPDSGVANTPDGGAADAPDGGATDAPDSASVDAREGGGSRCAVRQSLHRRRNTAGDLHAGHGLQEGVQRRCRCWRPARGA